MHQANQSSDILQHPKKANRIQTDKTPILVAALEKNYQKEFLAV